MLEKDDYEHGVPVGLRGKFRELVAGDFQLTASRPDGVASIDADTASNIANHVAAYGDSLVPLRDEVWQTSIYRWMDVYWQLLVDLSTTREPVSDLVLHAKLADDAAFHIEVQSVHVP